MQKTHNFAVQVNLKAEALIGGNHFDGPGIRKISDDVSTRWHQLVAAADERNKLFNNALNFYKTAEQVSDRLIGYLTFYYYLICSIIISTSYLFAKNRCNTEKNQTNAHIP